MNQSEQPCDCRFLYGVSMRVCAYHANQQAEIEALTKERDEADREMTRLAKAINAAYGSIALDLWETPNAIAALVRDRQQAEQRIKALEAENRALREALEEWQRVGRQVKVDLKDAHAEIVRLQGGDPSSYTWPEWSGPANTLRWIDRLTPPTHPAAHPGRATRMPVMRRDALRGIVDAPEKS